MNQERFSLGDMEKPDTPPPTRAFMALRRETERQKNLAASAGALLQKEEEGGQARKKVERAHGTDGASSPAESSELHCGGEQRVR